MTAEQSLVGAMGCASWRSHCRLREHAALTGVATVIRGAKSLRIEHAGVMDLNEVGITDVVLAAIWRFGPRGAAYAISSHAEARHLGADIAIIHQPTSRILLYQAKLASSQDGEFGLKSPVTRQQLTRLRRQRVKIEDTWYQITGRLALYQHDLTPFLGPCLPSSIPGLWHGLWQFEPHPFHASGATDWSPAPEIGRKYYETVLTRHRCSPSGILAAPVPEGNGPVTSVAAAGTWSWEFETYQWLREEDETDRDETTAGQGPGRAAPDFEAYSPTIAAPAAPGPAQAAGIADALAARLRLPASTKLHVIALP